MSMPESLCAVEWKPVDSTGNRPTLQRELPLIGAISSHHELPMTVISRATFSACLTACLHHDGRDDAQVARAIHISAGYMSKFIRGVGEAWAKRLVLFMRETRCLAPLQKLADEMGCDVVVRSAHTAEVRALRAQLAMLEGRGR